MKILLAAINAKYIHSNLAVYNLKAYAKAHGQVVEMAEYTINQQKDEILKSLFLQAPDILCFSCYIWNISYVKEVIEEIGKVLPDTIIWVGGPEVSYDAATFLGNCKRVTGVMIGEGEATFLELVEYYQGIQKSLRTIKGIVFRKEKDTKEYMTTAPRPLLDLSEVPFCYENLAELEHKIIYYETSRGCPFSCSYCLSSIDKKLRFRAIDLVKKELQIFLDQEVPQVKFVDRTFNCKQEHALAIWNYLKEHDNGKTNFHFEIAADILNEEELILLGTLRPGLVQLEIGVQSTNAETIKAIRRTMDFSRVSEVVKRIQEKKNIHQHLDLIAGLPYEDYKSFAQSFNQVYALHPEQLQLGFLKVLKGAYMQEKVGDYDCQYQSQEPYEVLSTKWLSYADILRLKGVEAMVEVYYNSGQFKKTLEAIEGIEETPFGFFEKLAQFYEEKGYEEVSHSRMRRYEILLEFLKIEDGENILYYKECLLFDLYRRENLKSRPEWATDLGPYKEWMHLFYQGEEENPHYLVDYKGFKARQLSNMTHIEVFYGKGQEKKKEQKKEQRVLFDYQRRDPLTYDAKVYVVEK